MKTIGFIGTGNMGGALAKAAVKSMSCGAAQDEIKILLANRSQEKAAALAEELFRLRAELNAENADTIRISRKALVELAANTVAAARADYIFLGVKPQMMEDMLAEIAPVLKERAARGEYFVLVTMAAGLTMERIAAMAGGDYPVIRIMPNTPAAIGAGMILYAANALVTEEALSSFCALMQGAGRLSPLPEKLIDAGSAVSGCGPAFVYMFIEALADGGVLCGLPRAAAMEYAAMMVAGSAQMVLESGKHPGALKDAVCSPGGTTIEGVRVLEESGFRGAVMDAVIAAYEKNAALK